MPICPYSVACRCRRAGRACSISAVAQSRPAAPAVRNVTDTYFGVTVQDPYRYFENLKDPEVAAWMKGEAAYTKSVLRTFPAATNC